MEVPIRAYIRLLAKYLRPQRGRFALLAVCLPLTIGLRLANPQILRSFIDTAVSGGSAAALTWDALLFLVIAIVTPGLLVAAT